MSAASPFGQCPAPVLQYDRVVLGHGSGGRLGAELVAKLFLPAFHNDVLAAMEDQATVDGAPRIAVTTDAFVVKPIFFPGGDIGKLSVCGTVNDLVVGGARPLYLTAAFVIEEGLAIADLERVVRSMRRTCDDAGVKLVAGDTKVVDRGKADQVFITTTGVGVVPPERVARPISIANARPGDKVLVSGTLGDHGVAIMAAREGLELETSLESDCAPLGGLVRALLEAVPDVACMRDPTRGGLSSALHELSVASRAGVRLDEAAIPLRDEVRGACELLGLDPLYVANEGKLVAVVRPGDADRALAALRAHPLGKNAAIVGEITDARPGIVTMRSHIGGERVVPMLAGEQLPRIC